MSSIDDAVTRLQNIAVALSTITDVNGNSVTLRSAPDYPVDNVEPFPFSLAFLAGGSFRLTNRTIHHNFPTVAVEFHFSRVNIHQAELQARAVAVEFPQRLAGDPTLDGTVSTIVGGADSDIPYINRPFVWREQTATQPAIISQMIRFDIPLKLLKAPTATST